MRISRLVHPLPTLPERSVLTPSRDTLGLLQGKRFLLLTDPGVGELKEELRKLYSTIFVEQVVKNPMFKFRHVPHHLLL